MLFIIAEESSITPAIFVYVKTKSFLEAISSSSFKEKVFAEEFGLTLKVAKTEGLILRLGVYLGFLLVVDLLVDRWI